MRRRNRKKTVHTFALPVPLASCVVLAASLALAYVWMLCRCQTLGNELKDLEGRRDELLVQHQQELFKWTRLKAPQNLERALRTHGIQMTWPSSRQVVRLRAGDIRGDEWSGLADRQVARLDRAERKAD